MPGVARPIFKPGVVTGRWNPFCARMVEPEVGPDAASFQPFILLFGNWILVGGFSRFAAFASRVSLKAESRLISSSMRFEKR